MLKNTILIIIACLVSQASYAQDMVAFEITPHNNLIIKSLVNNTDSLDLMFQIAMEDAALSPLRSNKAESIRFDTTTYKEGLSRNNTVHIGNIRKEKVLFFDNELAGHGADGKIGTGIFADKSFKIDYDNLCFITYDLLPDTTGYTAVSLLSKEGRFFVLTQSLIDGKLYDHYILLQSGYSGGLIYDDAFTEAHQLEDKLHVHSEKALKNSSGQTVYIKNGTLQQLQLGEITINGVSASIFTGNARMQSTSYFGADLLRRFNWIFDKDRKIAYIQKSKYFDEPYYIVK